MAKGCDDLVKGRVDAGPAYLLDLGFGIERDRDAVVELLLGLRDELAMSISGGRHGGY